jgi:uracil-DNA glycosylase family 4
MPLPGPSFTKLAESISGEKVETIGAYKNKRLAKELPALRAAYAMALYEPWFTMNITTKGRQKPCRFIPGHIWFNDRADGPRSRAKVMVIGKMPGRDEERTGRNLVGPSGQLLKDTLDKYAIYDYGSWYVTNLMRFPHPTPEQGLGLAAYWIKDCRPLLWQEIRLVRPDYILCLGSEAAKEVLGEFGGVQMSSNKVHDKSVKIDYEYPVPVACPQCKGTGDQYNDSGTKIRCQTCEGGGWLHTSDQFHYHHYKVMTCIHPAAVLRAPDLGTQFSESVKLFCNLLKSGGVNIQETGVEYVITDKEEVLEREVNKIIARTPESAITAIDAEWHGEHPWDEGAYLRTIQISDQPKYALCVVLNKEGGAPAFTAKDGTVDSHAAVPHLTRLLKSTESRNVRACGHFFRADLPQIKWHLGIDLMPEHEAPSGAEDDAPFRMKYEGGLDTGLAANAVRESDDYKLEVLGTRYTPMHRWDGKLQQWKKKFCASHDISPEDLEGYGECPGSIEDEEEDVLYRYGCCDVDATRRLVDVYNGIGDKPGLLDYDDFGLCSRRSCWIAMRAVPAAAEMEAVGLRVDRNRAERMVDIYMERYNTLLESLKQEINWPNFNIDSPFHVRELLYGIGMSGTIDKEFGGTGKRVSPEGAILCNLQPVKATGKDNKKSWADLTRTGEAKYRMASTDKESLGILAAKSPIARKIRDIRFLNQLLKTTLRRPKLEESRVKTRKLVHVKGKVTTRSCFQCKNKEPARLTCKKCDGKGKVTFVVEARDVMRSVWTKNYHVAYDDDGNRIFDRGLLSHISKYDGCIHTTLYQTLETGRWSSARPNLQNIGKRREDDYKGILGWINDKGEVVGRYPDLPPEYLYPLRSIFVADEGEVLIEADYIGAELACMAWMSQDQKMIEHVDRAMLNEKDPNYYDIHSAVAVAAFKLRVPSVDAGAKLTALYGRIINEGDPCPATKDALAICGYKALRVAAKNVMFGFAYGRGAEAIQRQCKEEGANVSIEEAQALIDGLKAMYTGLPVYFDGCRLRVRNPGWICSSGGYFRRIQGKIEDRQVQGELERQFMNFRIQNLVAYAASRACDHLMQYRREHPEVEFKLALQIHDAVILKVPYKWVEHVYDVVLPECMCKRVPIWATDLDGYVLPHAPDPYYLNIDKEVMFRWSEKIYEDTPNANKLPSRFVKKRKAA